MSSNHKILVPEAKGSLDKFKNEIASEFGIDNNDHKYKGNLTARENGNHGGNVGGEMMRRMIESYEKGLK